MVKYEYYTLRNGKTFRTFEFKNIYFYFIYCILNKCKNKQQVSKTAGEGLIHPGRKILSFTHVTNISSILFSFIFSVTQNQNYEMMAILFFSLETNIDSQKVNINSPYTTCTLFFQVFWCFMWRTVWNQSSLTKNHVFFAVHIWCIFDLHKNMQHSQSNCTETLQLSSALF